MTRAPRGRAIGATADGYIDRPKNQMALKGSLVPAYGLNSVLGNIPLLGDVLVSKKGEGIFGVTYSATGNADQPKISVNPLSVLTPGILRRIFEGHMPTPPMRRRTRHQHRRRRNAVHAAERPAPRRRRRKRIRPASPERASSCRWRASARRRC